MTNASELTLTSLNMSFNNISAAGAIAFSKNITLTSLNVSYNKIGDGGVMACVGNTTLTTFNVRSGNNISAEVARVLAEKTPLPSLDVRSIGIDDAAATAPAETDLHKKADCLTSVPVPSLLSLCFLKVKHPKELDQAELPQDIIENLKNLKC